MTASERMLPFAFELAGNSPVAAAGARGRGGEGCDVSRRWTTAGKRSCATDVPAGAAAVRKLRVVGDGEPRPTGRPGQDVEAVRLRRPGAGPAGGGGVPVSRDALTSPKGWTLTYETPAPLVEFPDALRAEGHTVAIRRSLKRGSSSRASPLRARRESLWIRSYTRRLQSPCSRPPGPALAAAQPADPPSAGSPSRRTSGWPRPSRSCSTASPPTRSTTCSASSTRPATTSSPSTATSSARPGGSPSRSWPSCRPTPCKAYHDRIDEPARKLLDAGKKDRDPRPLRQLLDRYFVSRPAEEALLLLGELLFERGEFRAAERLWRRLLPATRTADLRYPDPKTDPAAVRARVVLARDLPGRTRPRATAELAQFQKDHPKAAGRSPGRTGRTPTRWQELLDRPPRSPPTRPATALDRRSPAGPPATAASTGRLPRLLAGPPDRGRAPIPPRRRGDRRRPCRRVAAGRAAGVPPGRARTGVVYIADAGAGVRVRPADRHAAVRLRPARRPGRPRPRPTCRRCRPGRRRLHPDRGRRPAVRPARPARRLPDRPDDDRQGPHAASSASRRRRRGRDATLRPLRRSGSPPAGGRRRSPAAWEGAPLAADGRMYAAFARFEGDAAGPRDRVLRPDPPGRAALGRRRVSTARPAGDRRHRHELLTLAGRNVVFCSNAGAVVASTRGTGKPAWAFRYPRAAGRRRPVRPRPEPAGRRRRAGVRRPGRRRPRCSPSTPRPAGCCGKRADRRWTKSSAWPAAGWSCASPGRSAASAG